MLILLAARYRKWIGLWRQKSFYMNVQTIKKAIVASEVIIEGNTDFNDWRNAYFTIKRAVIQELGTHGIGLDQINEEVNKIIEETNEK